MDQATFARAPSPPGKPGQPGHRTPPPGPQGATSRADPAPPSQQPPPEELAPAPAAAADDTVVDEAIDQPAPAEEKWPLVYHLQPRRKGQKPVIAHGDVIDKLVLREPTVADIERHGMPVEINWLTDGTFTLKPIAKSMVPLLADLAAVNHGAIRSLSVAEYHGISTMLSSFFLPAWGGPQALDSKT